MSKEKIQDLIDRLFIFKDTETSLKLTALEKLEALGPEMSVKELSHSSLALEKFRDDEHDEEILRKIDELVNQFWKNQKSLEYEGLKKPLPKSPARNIQINSKNEFPNFGYVLGVLGLVLGLIGGYYLVQEINYELGCVDSEFIEEKYDEVNEDTILECLDDYKRISSIATFLTYVSPLLILFGILTVIYEYVKRK